jgi:hypothetical protein
MEKLYSYLKNDKNNEPNYCNIYLSFNNKGECVYFNHQDLALSWWGLQRNGDNWSKPVKYTKDY